jgi:hypothetical protein
MKPFRALYIVVLVASPLVQAQSSFEPPSAESIFERYVAVTGGRAAYDRIQNQVTMMTLSRDGALVSRSTAFRRALANSV